MQALSQNPVFVALDTTDIDQATAWATAVRPHAGGVKLGLEFVTSNGPAGVRHIVELGLPVFLDLKFHDIPNTVAGAVRAVAGLGAAIVNVHAAGGRAMLSAAAQAAAAGGPGGGAGRPMLIAVTVLTSLDDDDLAEIGQSGPVSAQATRLAKLAQACGLDGAVCSPAEITALRAACGDGFRLVVPGVRPAWAARDDQKRVMAPREALERGADILVIGRPITAADDPTAAAARIADELAGVR